LEDGAQPLGDGQTIESLRVAEARRVGLAFGGHRVQGGGQRGLATRRDE